MSEITESKSRLRNRVWDVLERERIAPHGGRGRIPAFVGAELAADRLAELPAWRAASVIKAVPDRAQQPVRARALRERKIVCMAAPRLAAPQPFCLLDPERLAGEPAAIAERHAAVEAGRPVSTAEMQPVDMVVCGSVAVGYTGARLGKGAGYTDIEAALLQEAGLIGEQTLMVTTVHDAQVLDQEIPEGEHDFRVDVIVTPTRTIHATAPRRSRGILWHLLSEEAIMSIPALGNRQDRPRHGAR
ncbi:5-formyltetrahydrofolate cyclo-ligase [Streptomyces sp. RFCAC02]|uniref:5-formyltetrahydrofolate cyclo-ligase n=1 Tax=Streptomyces sp. RFCAC02 TaxID=2499143 RepID=UPI001021C340|nr:5-formyltetrahydrofolate cyclo-ligase [Streptomyces sp. RFCAC02]